MIQGKIPAQSGSSLAVQGRNRNNTEANETTKWIAPLYETSVCKLLLDSTSQVSLPPRCYSPALWMGKISLCL